MPTKIYPKGSDLRSVYCTAESAVQCNRLLQCRVSRPDYGGRGRSIPLYGAEVTNAVQRPGIGGGKAGRAHVVQCTEVPVSAVHTGTTPAIRYICMSEHSDFEFVFVIYHLKIMYDKLFPYIFWGPSYRPIFL